MSVAVYTCNQCSAPLTYNIEVATWKCEYCGSEFAKDAVRQTTTSGRAVEKVEDLSVALPDLEEYACTTCGAALLSEGTTAATFCLYCKSPTIITSRFSGEFQPRYVIPFTITQEQAESIYFAWIRKRFFAPKAFKTATEVHNIRGIYAPYWLFDCRTAGFVEGEGRNSRSWRSGEYRITETTHYHVKRAGYADYQRVPVDGSEKLDDELMTGIEPFDFSQMHDFALQFMSGSLAERYDVDEVAALPAMEPRVQGFLEATLKQAGTQYQSFTINNRRFRVNGPKAAYAMLPVYILVNLHKGKKHTFMLNGQTGSVYGETPIEQGKRVLFAVAVFVATWLATVALGGLFGAV